MNENPYAPRLDTLRDRLQKHPGRDKLRDQLQRVRAKSQGFKAAQPAPVPYSGAYDSTMAGLGKTLADTQSDLAGQGLAVEQQYGFGSDQSNPFSIARQLERRQAQQRNQTTNSYAASGQLYAGSLSNQYGTDSYNAELDRDEAIRDYLSKQAGLATQGRQAQETYTTSANEAYIQKLQDALNQPPDPQEASKPSGGQGGGQGGGGGNYEAQERDRKERERKKKEEDDRKRGEFNRTHEHGKPIKKGKGK